MSSTPTPPDGALEHLKERILDAWLDVRPDRRDEASALHSHVGGNPIPVDVAGGSGGDPFACQPGLGLIHMKWWALEILWLAAYAFHELGARLAKDAESGTRQRSIEADPALTRGRDALAHAAVIIEKRESLTWPEHVPHPLGENQAVKAATETFLAALGWIEQHEVKHIIIDREPLAGDDFAEERACDAHATAWLLEGKGPGRLKEGVAVALFFLVLREAIMGKGPSTHPPSAERVRITKITPRHAKWLAVVIDVLLQSGGHETPATSGKSYDARELLAAELDRLEEVLHAPMQLSQFRSE